MRICVLVFKLRYTRFGFVQYIHITVLTFYGIKTKFSLSLSYSHILVFLVILRDSAIYCVCVCVFVALARAIHLFNSLTRSPSRRVGSNGRENERTNEKKRSKFIRKSPCSRQYQFNIAQTLFKSLFCVSFPREVWRKKTEITQNEIKIKQNEEDRRDICIRNSFCLFFRR